MHYRPNSRRAPRRRALREWLLLFVDFIATKHDIYEALNSIVGGTTELYSASTEQMKRAMAKLIDRTVASGEVRLDVDPLDLLRAIAGVANLSAGPDGKEAAKRMVDALIAESVAERELRFRNVVAQSRDAFQNTGDSPALSPQLLNFLKNQPERAIDFARH
jgi:hypothetical protein